MAVSSRVLTVSEDWDFTASLDNLLLCLTTLTIKKSRILFLHWNGIFWFQLVPVFFAVSLDSTEKGLLLIKVSKETITKSDLWFRADLGQPQHWRSLDSGGLSLTLTDLVAIHSPFSCKARWDLSSDCYILSAGKAYGKQWWFIWSQQIHLRNQKSQVLSHQPFYSIVHSHWNWKWVEDFDLNKHCKQLTHTWGIHWKKSTASFPVWNEKNCLV